LHLINAGGLVGLPALSGLLGFSSLGRVDKLFFLGIPVVVYTIGPLSAGVSALCAYFNFLQWARWTELDEEAQLLASDAVLPWPDAAEKDTARNQRLDAIASEREKVLSKLNKSHFRSHVFGWVSVSCFVGASTFLVANVR
jgi:hypothetical protein